MDKSPHEKKPESVLISGGSGLVGRYLTSLLLSEGYKVSHLSRKTSRFGRVRVFRWDPENCILDPSILNEADYVVHLAGTNIGEKRWSGKQKKEIENSRILSARLIIETARSSGHHFKAFISASATGFYGSKTSERVFTEEDSNSDDFLGMVCKKWEEEADKSGEISSRVVKIRTAVVIEKNDSALSRLLIPARMGIFPLLGSGRQYLPWIHITDLCNIYLRAIKDEKMKGAYNAVAPSHTDQRTFMKILAVIMKKPFIPVPVPAFMIKLLMGEMASVVLKGSRVSSERIISAGYTFSFPSLEGALMDALTH